MAGKILCFTMLGLVSGVAGHFLLPASLLLTGLILLLASGFVAYIFLAEDASIGVILLTVFLLAAGVGLLRTDGRVSAQSPEALDAFVDTSVSAVGEVAAGVERGGGQTVPVTITSVNEQELAERATVMTYAGSFPEIRYGDRIEIVGQLEEPENFQTDTGRLFHYRTYLAKDDIFYVISRPQVEVLSRGAGSFVRQKLADVRRYFSSQITQTLPAPVSGFSRGVILGEQGGLGEDLLADFRTTGVVHVVVLSGFHVTIVSLIFFFLLRRARLSVPSASVGGVAAIILFALMVGPTATVVRASVMAGIALFGRGLGRSTDAGRALAVAVCAMVFFNPYILLYDPGFQLSVLATAGLIFGGDYVSARLRFVPQTLGLRETVTATICAQVAVFPLLLYVTGSVSVISLVANVLVLPVVPLFMGASALVMLTGVIPPLASALALPAYGLGSYALWIVRTLADVPLASISVGAVPVGVVLLLYAILIAGWLLLTGRWRALLYE